MRMKVFISLILVIMASLSVSCKQSTLWKGQIRIEDGITVVENPIEPMYEEPILTLSEDLRIGEQGDRPEYLFYKINSIAVDREGNIYVTDEGEKHVKVFDREGDYLRILGRPGQGPGEFGRPTEIFITAENELIIIDPSRRQVHSYATDGRYLESKNFETVYPLKVERNSRGDYYVLTYWREQGSLAGGFDLLKLSQDLENVSTLVKVPISNEAKSEEFDPIPEFAVGHDDCLVLGYAYNYTFKILSPEGETIRIIEKKYNLIPIPDEVKKKAEERNPDLNRDWPKHYRPFFNFFCDDLGRMFVITPGNAVAESMYDCDVFDPEGKFLCTIPIKLMMTSIMTLADDNLYLVDEDSEGNPIVKRFKMEWKI
jgi:hypothetical protein